MYVCVCVCVCVCVLWLTAVAKITMIFISHTTHTRDIYILQKYTFLKKLEIQTLFSEINI